MDQPLSPARVAAAEVVRAGAGILFANELSLERFRSEFQALIRPVVNGVAKGSMCAVVIDLRRSDRGSALAGNDSGHRTLELVRERVAAALRAEDRFAVVSTSELIAILPGVSSDTTVKFASQRLLRALNEPMVVAGRRVRLRPAVGCAFYPAHRTDAEGLMGAADEACARARSMSVAWALFNNSWSLDHQETLVEDLRVALANNELEVWMQPQIESKSRKCLSAEALIRWPRPLDKPPVHAGLVAELAENNGLMPALTDFVLNTGLRYLGMLDEHGIEIQLGVNLSASALGDTDFPRRVSLALDTWEIPAHRLTLEVTESSILHDFEGALAILIQLKRIGTRLSIDDFGTGYSSLSYLRRMPLDELKIDQVFVRKILENPTDKQIARSVIDLSHNFGLEAVAEGVESLDAAELLIEMGCDILQGYYFSKPITFTELVAWWPVHHALSEGEVPTNARR